MKPWIALAASAALACAPGGSSAQPAEAPVPGGPGVTGTLLIGN